VSPNGDRIGAGIAAGAGAADSAGAGNDLSRARTLAEIAHQIGAERLSADARALVQRVEDERFFVACVGEFKRGKSTFVNALIGHDVLPTGVLPVTTVPVVVRSGPTLSARVRTASGGSRDIAPGALAAYVSEQRNRRNRKGVESVEVFMPSAVLEDGLCLVDMPGLGSVFQSSTVAAHGFLPQIDVALVVVGVDPPLTRDELSVVERLAGTVSDIVLVLNKADRFTEAECSAASAFAVREIASRIGRELEPVFRVSALETLAGGGPQRDWTALVARLRDLASRSRRRLAHDALVRGIAHLSDRLLGALAAASAAVMQAVTETDRLASGLRNHAVSAAFDYLQFAKNLETDRERLIKALDEQRQIFLTEALPVARRELAHAMSHLVSGRGRAARREWRQGAEDVANRWLRPWLEAQARAAVIEARNADSRNEQLAREALARLHGEPAVASDTSASRQPAPGAAVPAPCEPAPPSLAKPDGLGDDALLARFLTPPSLPPPPAIVSPLQRLLDAVLPPGHVRKRIEREVRAYLEELFTSHSEDVASALLRHTAERRAEVVAHVHACEEELYAAVDAALARLRAQEVKGMDAAYPELEWLDALRKRVRAL
jgi:GTP-binding protein EngB required for normal cell division